jgi:hypothetical protein
MATLDQPGFTRDTRPNLFAARSHRHNGSNGSHNNSEAYLSARNTAIPPVKNAYPARDARYPARAAAIEDGRLVTDYRSQCSKNVKAGQQFHTKLWLINHAETLMDESRKRQVEWTGASLPMANTVPPPASMVHSTPFYSEVQPTHLKHGLGIARANAAAPDLFGTFTYAPTISEMQMNRKNIGLTVHSEGGRNSIRGAL